MIVTRQRRKPFPIARVLLPLVAILLIVAAFIVPASRAAIVQGPLAPLWHLSSERFAPIAAPFHFAAQNQLIARRNHEIVLLQAQLADSQRMLASSTKQEAALKAQVNQLAQQAANARTKSASAPISSGTAAAGALGSMTTSSAGDIAAGATLDDRRVAADWAAMDPTTAAKVVQRLPVPYDAKIFALMSANDVGAILDKVPAAFAARLTQENPALKP